MTRIAHISDLHLLESAHGSRRPRDRWRLSILTLGRNCDADAHRRRFHAALREATALRADHLVISGDLTEDGDPAQFEVLAEILLESSWNPDDVTIVPGNHDAYVTPLAFNRALDGPMRPFARTSSPGAITELPGVTLMAIDTTIEQHWIRAAGRVGDKQRRRMNDVLQLEEQRGRAVALAMHHPPMPWGLRLRFLEGLLDVDDVASILRARRNAHVLCGHIHRGGDHSIGSEDTARIFVADAVVDHASPVRLYEACSGSLWAVDERWRTPLASAVTAML